MKKSLGLLVLMLNGLCYSEVELVSALSAHVAHMCRELEVKAQQELTASELEGIENILNAFINMMKGVAHVMTHPNSKLAAWTGITDIITNTFKVITELAKNRNSVIDDIMVCDYDGNRGPHAHYTLETMERELIAQQMIETDPTKQIIASHVANVIGNCANIIADPHNPHVVGSNVAHILSGIINIAVQLGKRTPPVVAYDDLCDALLADELLMHYLTSVLEYEASRVRLLYLTIRA